MMVAPNANAVAHSVDLKGVQETMLWPLWNRASEARRPETVLKDSLCLELVEKIDYPFAAHFGRPNVLHAVRARYSDDLIKSFSEKHAYEPVVVALGEGLETQLWRLQETPLQWFSIDLPDASSLRQSFLPSHDKQHFIRKSVQDLAWLDSIPCDAPVFVSAAGLLMYFHEDEVIRLLTAIAERFSGAELFFDTIGPAISQKTKRGLDITKDYRAPEMPWGISIDEIPAFVERIPRLRTLSVKSFSEPFPKRTPVYRIMSGIGILRRRFASSLVHAKVDP
ncbi:MAG: class I SAM-dependent methyltransferase [Pseudomonadota bacterium]